MMLGNESDKDTDDIDMYMKTIHQTHQLSTIKHHQDENRPVTENYSLNQWPELTTLALRYLLKPYAANSSNRIRLTSTLNDVTSTGMTAAETLANAIQSARKKTADDIFDDSYIDGDYSEELCADNYQQDANAVDEIWDYEGFSFDEDENDDCDEFQYNNMFTRLNDELDISDENNKEEESNENEIVDSGDNDELEPYLYQDDKDNSSSSDEETYLDSMDDMSSDGSFYTKQTNNRLLRIGRKHTLHGRKNSWKVIVD